MPNICYLLKSNNYFNFSFYFIDIQTQSKDLKVNMAEIIFIGSFMQSKKQASKCKSAKRLQKQANARVQDSDFIKTKMIYDRIRKKYQVSANDQQEDIIYLKTTIDEESVFKIFDSKTKEILNITLTKNSQKKSNVDYLLNFIIKECEPYLKLDLQKNSKLKAMILAYYPDRNKDHEDLSGYWIQKCNVISGVLFEIKKAFPYLWKN